MTSLTVPLSLICGRTRSVRPTSRRSTVWNGLTLAAPLEAGVTYWPVTKGTFWPTMMRASSLSSVMMFGVERMFTFDIDSSARARNCRFAIVPTPGKVIWPFATPIARPCPTVAGFCATPRMFWPEVPKFVPARPPVPPVPCRLPRPACHWMPHSAAWSLVTSMIRLSMNTCARRMSSLSITARRLR